MLGSFVLKVLGGLGHIDYAGLGKPPFNTTAPFNRTYDIEEAKGHFLKKKAKDADSVFLMTRRDPKGKNVIDYDMEAIQGYNEILFRDKIRKQTEMHNEINRLLAQKSRMKSGANAFVKLSGNSGKINRAKREIDEAVAKLRAAIPEVEKQFEKMMLKDNLPILNDKVQRKARFVPLKRKKAGATEQSAVNIFEEME